MAGCNVHWAWLASGCTLPPARPAPPPVHDVEVHDHGPSAADGLHDGGGVGAHPLEAGLRRDGQGAGQGRGAGAAHAVGCLVRVSGLGGGKSFTNVVEHVVCGGEAAGW